MLNEKVQEAIGKIEAQQPEKRTAVWMVGEQLKDMVRAEPHVAEIIIRDMDIEGMSLANCEKKIKEFADKNKTGSFACVTPVESDRIIREFYGLGATPQSASPTAPYPQGARRICMTAEPSTAALLTRGANLVDLSDFF